MSLSYACARHPHAGRGILGKIDPLIGSSPGWMMTGRRSRRASGHGMARHQVLHRPRSQHLLGLREFGDKQLVFISLSLPFLAVPEEGRPYSARASGTHAGLSGPNGRNPPVRGPSRTMLARAGPRKGDSKRRR